MGPALVLDVTHSFCPRCVVAAEVPFYSYDKAVGIVMGIGNVGPQLSSSPASGWFRVEGLGNSCA